MATQEATEALDTGPETGPMIGRLLTELDLPADAVTGWARDSCSTNGSALSAFQACVPSNRARRARKMKRYNAK